MKKHMKLFADVKTLRHTVIKQTDLSKWTERDTKLYHLIVAPLKVLKIFFSC